VNDKKNEINGAGLYTPEQKLRRDQTVWTLVQGVLAPLQFLVFAVSAVFVVNFLLNGTGLFAATVSVVIKTGILYTIMVTGAIWEKVVFGRYLFAPAFFWEDVVSMGVIALHSLYLVMLLAGWGTPQEQMWVALAAYGAYVVNAVQFLMKFQQAKASSTEPRTSFTGDEISVGARI
jgi:3-vinyl bacteriochlorophyllide hydratase